MQFREQKKIIEHRFTRFIRINADKFINIFIQRYKDFYFLKSIKICLYQRPITFLALTLAIIFIPLFANSLDYPHTGVNGIACSSCHFVHGPAPEWYTHVPQDIDDTPYNNLCKSCHDDITAPYRRTHSSLTTDNSYGNWTVECKVCHDPHQQKQFRTWGSDSYLYSGASTAITTTTITKTGAGWTVDQYKGLIVVPNTSQVSNNYKILSNTEDTLTVKGTINLSKVTVGNTFAIVYGKLIKSTSDLSKITITPAKSGTKTTKFFNLTGTNSFADGDETYDGVCEVCHTQTSHFRNDGTGSDPLHTNVGAPAGTNCISCHSHTNGFAHGGGGGTGCDSCHGHDAGWQGNNNYGKGTYKSHSTHTENDNDDLKGPYVNCDTCHDTNNFPYFKSGTDSNGDGKYSLSETDVCNTCHSPGGTYDGVNDAAIGAKSNWQNGVYSGANLMSGKEKWCAGCHDESPSVIQSVSAPNVIGDEDGLYTYGPGWGFYKTGHGLPSGQKYPASGGITAGAGKGCLDCHDSTLAHIDGNIRTFGCDDGCDTTEYRLGYRLGLISGQIPMQIPLPQNTDPLNNSGQFRLCYNCHNSGTFLNSGDMNTNLVTEGINRHEYHLNLNQLRYPADYNYGGTFNSRITCVTCHNVHGSTRLAMVRDGKLIGREPGLQIWYRNDDIVQWSSSSSNPPNPEDLRLTASTGTLIIYNSSSNLCTHCHAAANMVGELRTPFQDVSRAPTIDWTGENSYTTDGVNPDSAISGSNFTFRVKYTDANNNAPVFIEVWVDENDNGTYEAGEKKAMSEFNTSDINYTDGKLYTKTLSLVKAGDTVLNYRFYASDGQVAAGPPASDSTVTVTNNIPALSWTGEKYFESDGVNPDTGGNGANFVFRINYTDSDNEAPSSIQVWVDENDNGTYEAGEKYAMTAVDGDITYTDGKLYTKSLTLANAGDGDLRYRFYANDGTDSATGNPTSDSTVTVLSSANTPPTLAWTTANCLTYGARPAAGATGVDFEFRVEYTDTNNQPPSSIQVWVDSNDNGSYETGEKYAMTEADGGDTTYTDGKVYKYTLAISYAGNGVLNYRFYATDGTNEASGNPTTDSTLTVINTTYKVRPTGGSGWYSTIADALTASPASSTVLVYPNTDFTAATFSGGLFNINKTNRTIQSVCGADLTVISGGDSVINLQGNDGAVIDGFTITGGITYGIYSNSDSLTVKNSKVHTNPTGIHLNNGCNPVSIQNTSVYSNTSYGIYSPSTLNLVSIANSTIYNNGGGATAGPGVNLNGGAGTHTITNSSFTGNTTTGNGGAIYCNNCVITIDDSTINNNIAGSGGAIFFLNASVNATITDTFIQGNESTIGLGGAIYMGAGAESLTNVMLTGNRAATNGGAIYVNAGTTDCLFCTMSGNYAGSYGGALYQNSSTQTTIQNSIVYNNDALNGGNYKQIYATSPRYDYVDVYYTLINQTPGANIGGTPDQRCSYEDMGGNDISNESFFVNGLSPLSAPTTAGDYHIQLISYAINAASSSWTSDHDIFGGSRPSGGAYDMGAHEYASDNNAPSLSWTGEADYTADGVNPNSGAGGTSFEFRVDYTDANNNAPTVIQVWVDTNDNGSYEAGEKYNMTAVDGGDTTYTDGKRYTKTLTINYSGDGNIRYRFYASDGFSDATGSPTAHSMVSITNNVPALDWTGEANYITDGVNPDSGVNGASFTFRVKYTDADNTAPAAIQVWVDEDDSGTYEAGEKYTITVDGGDSNYTNGENYQKALTIYRTGDGVLNYRFYASDGTNDATGTPASNTAFTVTNNTPALNWKGDGGYVSDGVDPDSAPNGSSFVFKVKYTDADNNAPTSIEVWIDENDNSSYESGEKYTMTVEGGDGDYTNGEIFTKTNMLNHPGVGDGVLNYRFYAYDGAAAATGDPTSNMTVTIAGSNNPPTLDWTTAGCLTDGVRPSTGATGADYEFRIKYTDQDNNPPALIQVLVDLNDDGDYVDANETNTMTVDGGDSDYTNGEVYKYAVAISYTGDGTLKYKFAASDGTDAATGEPTSEGKTFTVVNTAYKVRLTGGAGWYSVLSDGYNATPASGTLLVYPNADFTAATYAGGLSNINKTNRALQSVCGADLTIISGGGPVINLQGNDGAVIDGFTITGGTTYGIYSNSDSLTVKNSKIHSNPTGIHLNNGCNPVSIQNTSIYSNTSYGINSPSTLNLVSISNSSIYNNGGGATNGAGIALNGGAGTHTITNSSFTGNSTTGNGGVIYCNACTMTIDDSTFNGNTGGAGGAIYLLNAATATITDTFIQGNSVTGSGGGINIATSTGHAIMTNVIITGNKAATNGGAIYEGGYTDCLFCTISGNYAGNLGGAIYHLNSVTTTIRNSIIYNNDALNQPNYKQIYATSPRYTYVDVYYTLINQAPGSGSFPDNQSYENMGGNNISSNPNFVTPIANPSTDTPTTDGDFHIQSGSPAVNAASSSWTSDHDIFSGSRPLGGGYDMGADEKE